MVNDEKSILSKISAFKNTILYTSREFDFETGLQFNRMRYYSPRLGRFINMDFIDLSMNKFPFQYANNNPITFFDGLGLWSNPIPSMWSRGPDNLNPICGAQSISPQGNVFCYQTMRCNDPNYNCVIGGGTSYCYCVYVGLP